MNIFQVARQESIKKIIELGKFGFYPIFESSWLDEVQDNNNPLNKKEQERAKSLLKRLTQHRSMDRQKTVLFTMPQNDRRIVIKTLLKLVEGKMIDEAPTLH